MEAARTHKAGLVVIGWGPWKHLVNYACPCLDPAFPETLEPQLDRRTWKLRAGAPQVVPAVLFACFMPHDPIALDPRWSGCPKNRCCS
jgi:hypothetical protein